MNNRLIPPHPWRPPEIRPLLQKIALDRFNNYLTDEKFAEDYGLSLAEAKDLIRLATSVHEAIVANSR